jgi:hypothetical protein
MNVLQRSNRRGKVTLRVTSDRFTMSAPCPLYPESDKIAASHQVRLGPSATFSNAEKAAFLKHPSSRSQSAVLATVFPLVLRGGVMGMP